MRYARREHGPPHQLPPRVRPTSLRASPACRSARCRPAWVSGSPPRRRRSRRRSGPGRSRSRNDAAPRSGPVPASPSGPASSSRAATAYSSLRVVPNIGGSSELMVTRTPASTSCRSGCSSRSGDRAGAHVGGRADLQRDAPLGQVRRAAPGPVRRRCRGRSARRPGRAARPRRSAGRWSPRRAGRERSPAARARSKYGLNCGRGTPISGPPSPKLTSPSGRSSSAIRRVSSAAGRPASPGMSKHQRSTMPKSASAALAGVLDRLAERRRGDAPAHVRVRGDGQLGVPDLLPGQFPGHLVGEQPDVLGVPDQVDDAEVDLDEVGEVAEGEVVGERLRVGRHRDCVPRAGRPARRRSAGRRSRRGARAAPPWAVRR